MDDGEVHGDSIHCGAGPVSHHQRVFARSTLRRDQSAFAGRTTAADCLRIYASRVNVEGIKANPASITVTIPHRDGTFTATVQREKFSARSGYNLIDQTPSPGATP